MKKKLLPSILSFWSICLFSQVGINTSQPNATLDIHSKGIDSSTKALRINNSTPSSQELVTVLDNGNMGINNVAPQTKLSIKSQIPGSGFNLSDGSQGAGKILASDANGNASWVQTTPTITIDSTPGLSVNIDRVSTQMTYTGATAHVIVPGNYLVTIRLISDKGPNGCNRYLAANLNKNSSTVFDRTTAAFPLQEIHTAPGYDSFDFFYTSQVAYLTEGDYYMMIRISGGETCSSYITRSGLGENSFTLTLLK